MPRNYARLNGYLTERSAMPFAWGREANDCVAYAIGAVLAQGGTLSREDLPDWSSALEARRAIAGAGGLAEAIGRHLPEIAPAHAHRGDIAGVVHAEALGGILLMVIEGPTLVGPGDKRLPRRFMTRAWCAVP